MVASGQRALVAQVVLERLRAALNRGQSWCGDLLGGNHALAAQKLEKVSQRGRIAPVTAHPSSAITQVPCGMLGENVRSRDAASVPAID